MKYVLATQADFFIIHLVCKKMKDYNLKPLCSLHGDFSDDQILAFLASMKVEGPKGWKPSITIEGQTRDVQNPWEEIEGELQRSAKITGIGLMLILWHGGIQWESIVFRGIRLGNRVLDIGDRGTCLQNLQVLELSNCDGYSSTGFLNFARANVSSNAALRSLQVLRIQPLHRGQLHDRVSDKIFMSFQRLTALRELELRRCAEISDDGLRSYYTFQPDTWVALPAWDISEGRARLGQYVKVTLVDCDNITPLCVQELREQYPEIYLELRKTSDEIA